MTFTPNCCPAASSSCNALAGHVDLAIGSAALVTPQVSGGKLRGLAQTGATRVPDDEGPQW
jgi:tripartite-type tricarboxylate transporter receptor subunit TctC